MSSERNEQWIGRLSRWFKRKTSFVRQAKGRRDVARTALKGVVLSASILGAASDCSAHFGFGRGYYGYGWRHGWHGVPYYSSYGSYRAYYPRHYMGYYRPVVARPAYVNPWYLAPVQYYTPPVCVAPVYAAPVCAPIYSVPVYRIPACPPPVYSIQVGFSPFCQTVPALPGASAVQTYATTSSWAGSAVASKASSVPPRIAVENWPDTRDEYAAEEAAKFSSVRPPLRLVSTQIEISDDSNNRSRSIVAAKPAIKPLSPTSAIWSNSATSLLDEMIMRGDMKNALRSCNAMAENPQPLSKGVYLRHGILLLFTPDTETDVKRVMDVLNMAAAAGCEFAPDALVGNRLADYLLPSGVRLQDSLNQLSESALSSKTDGAASILLIAVLLKMDGQVERAKVFASEAFERASNSDSFAWHSLLAAVNKL